MEWSQKDDSEQVWINEKLDLLRYSQIVIIRSLVILCILCVTVSGATADASPAQLTLLQQTEDEFSEETILIVFQTVLEEQGVETETVEINEDEGILHVEYYTTATTERQVGEEMGTITGAYVGAIDEGVTTDRMEAIAFDPVDDSETASWYVETEWVESYNTGEMTSDEFFMRILLTLEPVEN